MYLRMALYACMTVTVYTMHHPIDYYVTELYRVCYNNIIHDIHAL